MVSRGGKELLNLEILEEIPFLWLSFEITLRVQDLKLVFVQCLWPKKHGIFHLLSGYVSNLGIGNPHNYSYSHSYSYSYHPQTRHVFPGWYFDDFFPHLFLQNSAGRCHDRPGFQVLSRELPSFNVGASCAEGASGVPQAGRCALLGMSRNFRPFFLISIYGLRWVRVSKWLRFISFISKPYWNMLWNHMSRFCLAIFVGLETCIFPSFHCCAGDSLPQGWGHLQPFGLRAGRLQVLPCGWLQVGLCRVPWRMMGGDGCDFLGENQVK